MDKRSRLLISVTELTDSNENTFKKKLIYTVQKTNSKKKEDITEIPKYNLSDTVNLEYEPKSTHCLLFKFYYKKKALTKDNLFGSFFVNINDVKEKDWLQHVYYIKRKKKNTPIIVGKASIRFIQKEEWSVDFFELLPPEITWKILNYFSVENLLQICQVNKNWNRLASNERLWHFYFREKWPNGVSILPPNTTNWKHRYINNRSQYSTINEALLYINHSESLLLSPGIYNESVYITQPLELIGDNTNGNQVIISSKGKNALFFRAKYGKIKNITFMGGGSHCVCITGNGQLIMEDCTITHDLSISPPLLPLNNNINNNINVNHSSFPFSSPLYSAVPPFYPNYPIPSPHLPCDPLFDNKLNNKSNNNNNNNNSNSDEENPNNDLHNENNIINNNLENNIENNNNNSLLACVSISNSANPILRRNIIKNGKGIGVLIYDHGKGILENNIITDHPHSCIEIRNESNPIFKANLIANSKSFGILMINSNAIIEQNDIFGHFQSGVKIHESSCRFQNNSVHHCKFRGIVVSGFGDCFFEQNLIYQNYHTAITVRNNANPMFIFNQIFDGNSAGILVHNHGKGFFSDNFIFNNNLSAVEIRKGGDPRIVNSHIFNCKELTKRTGGIYIHMGGLGYYENNNIYNNKRSQITITNSNPIIRNNKIYNGKTVGITITDSNGIIENNDIHDQQLGILIKEKGATIIRENKIHHHNQCGILLMNGGNSLLELNSIFNNSKGVHIKKSSAKLVGNFIHSQKFGVIIEDSSSPLLRSNDVYNIKKMGIKITTDSNPILVNNKVHNCSGYAILIDNSKGTLQDNKIYSNKKVGVVIRNYANPVLSQNVISDGEESGILIYDHGKGYLEENEVFNISNFACVEIRKNANPILMSNRIHSGNYVGVLIHQFAQGLLEDNEIYNHMLSGVQVSDDSRPHLMNNQIYNNHLLANNLNQAQMEKNE